MHGSPRWVSPPALLYVVGLIAGCGSTRTLTIDIQSDLVAEYELGSLDIELFAGAVGSGSTGTVLRSLVVEPALADADAYRRGRRTAELTELSPGNYTVRVVARRPPPEGAPIEAGTFLVERRVVVPLETDRVVRVVVTAPCVDHTCPGAGDPSDHTQCLNGECVDPSCDPTEPGATERCCTGAGCVETAVCSSAAECVVAPCAVASCVEGACIAAERPGACGEGEYCDRSAGTCLPVPGGPVRDAGPEDAALPDASVPDASVPGADARCPAETCGNGTDDDCDGRADCDDTDCIGTPCDDGDPCTHGDACTATMGRACSGTAITCDSTPCLARACNGTASCTETPIGGACPDDGNGCTDDVCSAGACTHPPVAGTPPCGDDGNVCTSDVCSGGACTHPPVAGTVFCADDGNPCSFDLCDAGACTHPRGFDGWACGAGGRCCGNACVDVSSDANNCGVCGIVCPHGCSGGACSSISNAECIAAGYGPLATAYMGVCQCRCNTVDTDRLTCTGQCAGGATCDQRTGVNVCFYP
ncbi:MAG: hypothetical protein K1X94_28870 [Sandaracinaceae bacterium]|nr:hypothetical protein [Sandaracinaceae bacterium]